MAKVSVIIPARNEQYLTWTVANVFKAATGDIEVIAVMDGCGEYLTPAERPGLIVIRKPYPEGMRAAINSGVAASSGQYIMKLDAHCMLGEGFDEILQKDCDDDWIVTCRRFDLDRLTMKLGTNAPVDYFYMSFPWHHPKWFIIQSCPWVTRTNERKEFMIDENLTLHGAMWFMSRRHWDWLGGMHDEGYGGFAGEPLEIGNKTWLGGGKLMVNKNTWHAHTNSGGKKGYSVDSTHMIEGLTWGSHYWIENRWEGRIHDFKWLIERFWPLPTEEKHSGWEEKLWPNNWRTYL